MKEEGVEVVKNAEVTQMLNSGDKIEGVQINNKKNMDFYLIKKLKE